MKEFGKCLFFAVLVPAILFVSITPIAYRLTDYYSYKGTNIITLAEYKVLITALPNINSMQSTSYNPDTDRILITYDFIGKPKYKILYGLSGERQTYWQFLNNPSITPSKGN